MNGSPTCGVETQSSMAATSRTDLACTRLTEYPQPPSSTTGPTETRMREGLRPTPPHQLAGIRIEPPMSEPCAIGTMLASTAAWAPPEEPPAEWPCFQGLQVLPNSTLSVLADIEYSGAAERPRMLTPEAFSMSTK